MSPRSKRQLLRWSLPLLTIAILISSFFYWRSRALYAQWHYDFTHDNTPVRSSGTLHQRLASFPTCSWAELPKAYREQSGSESPKFKKLLTNKTFRLVSSYDANMRIVGNFRIKDFMSKDQFYAASLTNKQVKNYWLIDERVLQKILEIQVSLRAKGYNADAFRINSGHRTPHLNHRVGGASLSRHIQGQAADLHIGDIDRNGRFTQRDKQIVLDLVEKEIIGKEGGIGRYPGTNVVHIDVRGYRARWDSY